MAHHRRRAKGKKPASLPDYVKTAHDRQHSTLATSEDTFKRHAAKRGDPLIVSRDGVKLFGMRKLSVAEIMELRIDERYQREEVVPEVNTLIHVLKRGGMIPDPTSVVEREYGDRGSYVVDGQQRWWAHIDVGVPMQAIIYKVASFEDEVALFQTLNMQRRLNPKTRVALWPRAAGKTLHNLNDSGDSPLYQRIAFGEAGATVVGAIPLLRGMLATIANLSLIGSVDQLLQSFDRHYEQKHPWSEWAVRNYARIVSQIFHDAQDHRLRPIPAIAIGRMCYSLWRSAPNADTMKMPSAKQISRLRGTNWSKLLPSSSPQWMPTVMAYLQSIWPVAMAAEENGVGPVGAE